MDTLLGYLATVSEVTRQSGDTIGNAFKTITARFENVKLGKIDDEGLGINDVETALGRVGIAIRENATTFRDMEDVLGEVAKGWKNYDDVTKSSITTALAGTRQREYMISLLENYDRALELSGESADSAGLAQDRYNIYLDSTEAKLNRLKTSMQELYTSFLKSDYINMFIDGTTGVLNFISALGGIPTLLMSISGAMLIIKNQSLSIMGINMLNSIKSIGFQASDLVTKLGLVGKSMHQAKIHGANFSQQLTVASRAMDLMNLKARLVSVGIGLLVSAISIYSMVQAKLKQREEERIQALKDQASETKDALTNIEDLKSKYEELYHTTNRTEEQNKQLLKVQDDLTKSLGLEKGAIDATKDSWQNVIDKIKEAKNEKLKYLISDQTEIVDNAKKDYEDAINNGSYSGKFSIEDNGNAELQKWLRENYLYALDWDAEGTTYLDSTKMKAEDFVTALKEIKIKMQKLNGYSDTKFFKTFSGELANLESKYATFSEEQMELFESMSAQDVEPILKNLGVDNIENITKEQSDKIKQSFTDLYVATGKVQDQEYIQYFYDMVDAIQAEKEALDNLNNSQNTNSSSWNTISTSFKELSSDSDILKTALEELTTTQTLTEDTLKSLAEKYPQLANSMGSVEEAIAGINREINNQRIDDYADSVDELNDVIDKLKDGQQLSGKEITELTEKYPQLKSAVTETNGVYSLEISALENLKSSMETATKKSIENEIKKTKTVIDQTRARMQAYLQEKKAYAELSGLQFQEDGTIQDSGAFTAMMSKDENLQKIYNNYNKYIQTYKDLEEQLDSIDIIGQEGSSQKKSKDKSYIEEGFQDRLDLIKAKREELVNEISKLQSQIEIATSKHGDASPYVQNLRDQLNKLKEDEASLIQSSAEELRKLRDDYFKRLTNGNSLFEGLTAETFSETDLAKASRQMEKTIADLGDSEKANGLELNKSRIEEMGEAILSISEELSTLGDDFYSNKKEKLDEYISRIQDAISYEEELYSDKDNEAQLRFSILDETDDGYINTVISIQQDLIDAKLKLQETYKSKYENLLKQGLSAESSVMRELKTKWNDTNKEIFDMRKEMNEKFISYMNSKSSSVTASRDKVVEMLRKQDDLQKDIYDKQKDAIKEKADADKEALENRKKELDAIKSEYDYQNKIADLRRALADTLSDLNALEFDDSADAIQAKVELANQLQDDKQALADEEFNHAIEMAQEAIDKAIDAIEKQSNAQTEAIDRLIDALSNKTDKEYTNQANNMLLNDEEGTYKKLLEYNREWGDGIDNTITSLFDSAKPVLEEIRNANIGIQEALNNFANLAYSKQLENQSSGIMTFDDKAITGNGQIVSPDMISKSLNNVFIPVFDGLKNALATFNQTPKAITLSPQFNVYADGNVDNATLSEAQKWFLTVGMKTLENGLEKYLIPRSRNIVGTTK